VQSDESLVVDEETCARGVGRWGGDDLDVTAHGSVLGVCDRPTRCRLFIGGRNEDEARSVEAVREELERDTVGEEVGGNFEIRQKAPTLPPITRVRREEIILLVSALVFDEFSGDYGGD